MTDEERARLAIPKGVGNQALSRSQREIIKAAQERLDAVGGGVVAGQLLMDDPPIARRLLDLSSAEAEAIDKASHENGVLDERKRLLQLAEEMFKEDPLDDGARGVMVVGVKAGWRSALRNFIRRAGDKEPKARKEAVSLKYDPMPEMERWWRARSDSLGPSPDVSKVAMECLEVGRKYGLVEAGYRLAELFKDDPDQRLLILDALMAERTKEGIEP